MPDPKRELCDSSLILARKYKDEQKLARSFAHYLVHWQVSKLISSGNCCSLDEISQVLDNLTLNLELENRSADLMNTYKQAIEVLPSNEDTLFQYASALFKNGQSREAMKVLQGCQKLRCTELLDTIKAYVLDRWHFAMLNDEARNSAFARALRKFVTPSTGTVLDIGAGCGLLSILASQQRPKRVVACEGLEEMHDLAIEVLKANQAQVDLRHCLSTHLKMEAKADILVTETFDAGLLGEHILEILDHAWTHLLHENSLVLPCKARVFTSLMRSEAVHARVINKDIMALSADVDYLNEPYDTLRVRPEDLLVKEQLLIEIDFNDRKQIRELLRKGAKISQLFEGGISNSNCVAVLWFDLVFNEDIVLSTKPLSNGNDKCCWEQAIFPLIGQQAHKDQIELEFAIHEGHFRLCQSAPKGFQAFPAHFIEAFNLSSSTVQNFDFSVCKTVLDLSEIPVQSLHLLKENPEAKLTMFMWNNEDAKAKVDFVTLVASKSGIELGRIDGISSLETLKKDEYDVVIFDPVLPSGRLNSKALQKVSKVQCNLSPIKLTLWIALIESPDLVAAHKMPDNNAVFGLKIAEFMNAYSVSHLQNIHENFDMSFLSASINIHSIDFTEKITDPVKEELEIKMEKSGTIHAILYWFDIHHSKERKESTFSSRFYDKAAILLPHPVEINAEMDDYLSIEVTIEDFLLDLKLC